MIVRDPARASFEALVRQLSLTELDANFGMHWAVYAMKYLDEWESHYTCTLAKMKGKAYCVIESENALETLKHCLSTHFQMSLSEETSKCIHEFSFKNRMTDLYKDAFNKYYNKSLPQEQKDKMKAVFVSTLGKLKS